MIPKGFQGATGKPPGYKYLQRPWIVSFVMFPVNCTVLFPTGIVGNFPVYTPICGVPELFVTHSRSLSIFHPLAAPVMLMLLFPIRTVTDPLPVIVISGRLSVSPGFVICVPLVVTSIAASFAISFSGWQ